MRIISFIWCSVFAFYLYNTHLAGDGAALMSVSAMDVPSDVAAVTTVASGGSHSSVVSSNNGGVGSLCRLVVPEQAMAGVVSGVPVQVMATLVPCVFMT